MKTQLTSFALLLGLLGFNLLPARADAPRLPKAPVRQYSIEQFMKTIRFGGAALSPDEQTVLFSSNADGIFNLYEVPFSGGVPRQLTFSKTDALFAVGYLPDGRILYSSDKGGNELTHLFLRDQNGSVTDLTPGTNAKFGFSGLSHDRRSFYYQSNARNKTAFDLYEMDLATMTSRMIYENPGGLLPGAVSPDRRYIALTRPVTNAESDVYLYDTRAKTAQLLTRHSGEEANRAGAFTPDGRKLFISTDAGSEFRYTKAYDLTSGQLAVLDKANWDIVDDYPSQRGRYRVLSVNNDARTELRLIDQQTNRPAALPGVPAGDITGLDLGDSESRMVFFVNSSNAPATLYSYDLNSKRAVALVRGLNPEINPADLVQGQVIRYKSFDGLTIPALLYKPKGIPAGGRRPAMLLIHGGPGGQTRLNYSGQVQYLVNAGYVILAVNNRGSSGYGKSFYAADDRRHGDVDLRDCVEAKKFLAQTGYVDPQKIGIMGGSYGGYMTLAGLAFTPDEFAVGVDIFGVANWLRTLRSMPAWWGPQREAMFKEIGHPQADSVALYQKSPLFHTERIKKPLLVIQGANDPRVLKIESDEIVANVRKNGIPVEYITFPNEGHGFVRKENEITAYKAIREFLDKYLMKAPAAAR